MKLLHCKRVPRDITDALNQRAVDTGLSKNTVAVQILAEALGVDVHLPDQPPAGRHLFQMSPDGTDQFTLRVPKALHRKVRMRAASKDLTMCQVMMDVFSEALGVEVAA